MQAHPEVALGAVAIAVLIVVAAFVVVALVLGVAFYLVARQIKARTDGIRVGKSALDTLASQPGWQRTSNGAQGVHRTVRVKVSQIHVKRGADRNLARLTDMEASFPRPLGLGLSVSQKSALGFLRMPALGPVPPIVAADHPDFDAAFECRAVDPARAIPLLRQLAPALLAANPLAVLSLDDDGAHFRDEEWALEYPALIRRLDALADIVLAVQRAGG